MDWKPVGFDSFDEVPLHHRPLDKADPEIVMVRSDALGTILFHKPSTNQYWIQIGMEDGKCPTERCGAQCCKEGNPWPTKFGQSETGCIFLEGESCGIQQSKFLCCASAPEPWNGMENLDKCELRCVEVTRG